MNSDQLELSFEKPDGRHMSVTQLKMYLRCPLQYEFRYVKGLKIPPAGVMTLGKSIHSTLEENYRQKIRTGQDLSLEHWRDYFSDTWENSLEETVFEDGEKPEDLKNDGMKLIDVYHSQIAPNVQPVDVEREFLIDVDGVEVPLLGYIDLIDDKGFIIDHKVANKSWPKGREHSDLQLTAYALAYRQTEGKDENGLRYDVMVRTKNPKINQLETTRSQEDIRKFSKLLNHVNRSIKTGIFYPNDNFLCPVCGYADLCKKW